MTDNGTPAQERPRVTVIANPRAGSTTKELLSEVEDICALHAGSVEVLWTGERGHATELARRCALDETGHRSTVIVSIGGDGTAREVVTGLLEAKDSGARLPALLVLPGGTGNSNYRHFWQDMPWQRALTAGLTGQGSELRTYDLATIAGTSRLVVLGASTGLFAEATAEALAIPVAGRARYQAAITSVLARFTPYPGRVLVDGRPVHAGDTVLVNVGGGRYRAGVYETMPFSSPDDGLLDVCVIGSGIPAETALDLMRQGGAHVSSEHVTYKRGRRITLERTDGEPLSFEHDGEVLPGDATSITIDVLPKVLPVLVAPQGTKA
ncbi:diacylglycerol/lipid kinase family protein [Streptomyces sp. NPDC053048]|uniref:diacylglycerol/lipid kinase family protein n=1 Tax=Streptomyces sp. NPDC053048 TaxID=3365694 RepID=UPI0037CF67C7